MNTTIYQNMQGILVIAVSFFLAMILTIITLPDFVPLELGYLRPNWVALVLIYWIIALPHRIGLLTAWLIGVLMDVLLGNPLGQHCIALVMVAYISARLYQRLRMYSVWQQSLVIFAIVELSQLVNYWIENMLGIAEWNLWWLFPAVISAFLWSWVFLSLRFVRRVFHIT